MKKYFNILFLLLLTFAYSCSNSDFQDGYKIPIDQNEFRGSILLGNDDYEVKNLEVKEIEKGVRYAKLQLKEEEFPLVVHAVLVDLAEATDLQLEVLTADKNKIRARRTPSQIVKDYSDKEIIATINADFFDLADGYPLGAVMVDGVLRKSANYDWKNIFGFSQDGKPFLNTFAIDANAVGVNGDIRAINSMNSSRLANFVSIFDSQTGENSGTNPWGTDVLLQPMDVDWDNLVERKNVKCKIVKKAPDQGSIPIPEGHIVISGHGTGSEWINSNIINPLGGEMYITIGAKYATAEEDITAPMCMTGFHSILIKNSQKQSINESDAIATSKNPRSGIGYSLDRTKMAMIVVEGRSEESIGVTTAEFADIFAYFRISNAVNLDGGGSSCLVVQDDVVNTLSDGSERAVANVFSFVRKK